MCTYIQTCACTSRQLLLQFESTVHTSCLTHPREQRSAPLTLGPTQVGLSDGMGCHAEQSAVIPSPRPSGEYLPQHSTQEGCER